MGRKTSIIVLSDVDRRYLESQTRARTIQAQTVNRARILLLNNIVEFWNSVKRKEFLKMQLKGERYKHPSCENCMIPQDVTNEKDILDPYADEILKRFYSECRKKIYICLKTTAKLYGMILTVM